MNVGEIIMSSIAAWYHCFKFPRDIIIIKLYVCRSVLHSSGKYQINYNLCLLLFFSTKLFNIRKFKLVHDVNFDTLLKSIKCIGKFLTPLEVDRQNFETFETFVDLFNHLDKNMYPTTPTFFIYFIMAFICHLKYPQPSQTWNKWNLFSQELWNTGCGILRYYC